MSLTDEFIEQLIHCSKQVTKPPGTFRPERGHLRTGFDLQSIDNQFYFQIFGRVNMAFPENFSIGMIYLPRNEKTRYEIIRFNGPHGAHKSYPHHVQHHIHKASQEAIAHGLKENVFIEITDKYVNYQDAFLYFVRFINVTQEDLITYFPYPDRQLDLFEQE